MNIEPNFNDRDLDKFHQKILEESFTKAIHAYNYLGEEFISLARQDTDFIDQTGNLKSSIGYMLFVNGKLFKESFELHKEGYEGLERGAEFAKTLANQLMSNQIVLVFVAGMNYALHVESKGLNVLTRSENEMKARGVKLFKSLIK